MARRLPVQYAKILHGLTQGLSGADVKTAVASFACFLRSEGATKRVDNIVKEYEKLLAAERGEMPIEITSARPVSAALTGSIQKTFGAGAMSQRTNAALIGGIIVRKGNIIFDASIKTQLGKIAQSI